MGAAFTLLLAVQIGAADGARTDFGIRAVGSLPAGSTADPIPFRRLGNGPSIVAHAAAMAARWGRVTSTWRSPEHNRRVGGVRNSFHLSGRAIDIARRASVSHAEIEAGLRRSGYRLVESLDEGDHSHFAFATDPQPSSAKSVGKSTGTAWRIVTAPR